MQFEPMDPFNRTYPAAARTLFSVLAVLVALGVGQFAFAAETDVYKSISEDGSTLFTDKPKDKTTTLAPLGSTNYKKSSQDLSDETFEYEEGEIEPSDPKPLTVTAVEITSPRNEQSYINPRGPILVGITTGPENGMPEGYTAEIKIDGKVVTSTEGTLFAVPAVHGTHTMEAFVLDSTGVVQAKSLPLTIHIRKKSRNDSE